MTGVVTFTMSRHNVYFVEGILLDRSLQLFDGDGREGAVNGMSL